MNDDDEWGEHKLILQAEYSNPVTGVNILIRMWVFYDAFRLDFHRDRQLPLTKLRYLSVATT